MKIIPEEVNKRGLETGVVDKNSQFVWSYIFSLES